MIRIIIKAIEDFSINKLRIEFRGEGMLVSKGVPNLDYYRNDL